MCSDGHKDRKTRVEDAVSGLAMGILSESDRECCHAMIGRMIETLPEEGVSPFDLLFVVAELLARASNTLSNDARRLAPMAVATLAVRAQRDVDQRDMRIADAVGRN